MLIEVWTVKATDEVSNGNGNYVIGNWRKAHLCYKVAKNLVELCLCPHVLQKVELLRNDIRYLAEAISKQSVLDTAWLLLTMYTKI